jgi:hypothetical protein
MQNDWEVHDTCKDDVICARAPSRGVMDDHVPALYLNVLPSVSIAMQNVWVGQEIVSKPLGLGTLVVATCVRDERVWPDSV